MHRPHCRPRPCSSYPKNRRRVPEFDLRDLLVVLRPNVPTCTYGKWAMSRKLSVILVTESARFDAAVDPPETPGSSSADISRDVGALAHRGRSRSGRNCSTNVHDGKIRLRRHRVAPVPDDGTSTQAAGISEPPAVVGAHVRQPLVDSHPMLNGDSRWGHRSGAATRCPLGERHTT